MYLFGLAERLGRTVAELSREMSSREEAMWMEFDRRRPATPADYHAALICQVISTIPYGFAGKPAPPVEDFLPERARPSRGVTGIAMKHAFLAHHAHLLPPEPKP